MRDIWVIDSERWNTLRVAGDDDGMTTLDLERVEPIRSIARREA